MSSKRVNFVTRRKKAGLTQQQLATRLGVAVRTVQGWESGEYVPSLTPLQFWLMCHDFKCSAEDLARDFFPEAFSDSEAISTESPGDLAPN